MTETRVVIAAVIAVALSIALVVAGVALLAGTGWAFVAAGALTGVSSVHGAWALLRDDGRDG